MAKNRDLSKLANRLTVGNNYNVGVSGSLSVTGSIISTVSTLWSGSAQLPSGVVSGSAQTIANLPSGTVSGSAQILNGTTIHSGTFFNGVTVVSGSGQISYTGITNVPSGIISGSSQLPSGVVSGSSQITYSGLSGVPSNIISGSGQLTTLGIATTGSNTFNGNLTVTGFIDTQELRTTYISSSILYRSGSTKFGDELTDTHSFTGSILISGSISVPGSNLVSGSSQVLNGSGVFSGSAQLPSGIVSSSAQTIANLPSGVVSGSAQTIANLPSGTVSGSSQILNGTGFVKTSGASITYDNSTYLTTGTASSTYLPLAGGTVSGDIQMGSNQNLSIKFRTASAWDYSLKGINDDFFIRDNPGLNYLALYYNAGGNNRYTSLMGVFNVYASGAATLSGNLTLSSSSSTTDLGGVLIVRGNGSAYSTHYLTTGAANVAAYYQYDAAGVVKNVIHAGANSYITGGNFGIGTTSPIAKLQIGSNTFAGGNGVYADNRIGMMLNGSLTSYVYASTYNDPTYPDYGLVFIHGTNTSSYNVWSISPDGPAKGSGLHFIYGANATNIHTATPKISFIGSSGNVGIGISTPQAILDVSHTAGTTNIIRVSNGSGNYRWRIDQNFTMAMTNAAGVDTFSVNTSGAISTNSSITATTCLFNVNASSTISLTSAGTNASMVKAGSGDELYLGGNDTWQMRLSGGNVLMDNGGYVYLGKSWNATNHRINLEVAQGNNILVVSAYAGASNDSVVIKAAAGANPNAITSVMEVTTNSSTGRSISAGGTINASGNDYAEYMLKATTDTINKGDIVGININGKLTNIFNESISFVVKSTDPSYVGGDAWGNIVGKRPERTTDQTEEEFAPTLAEFEAKLEVERQKVDRIAFSGQVPVNVTGSTVGDYIIPIATEDGKITGQAITNPSFDQYKLSVGKVWKIMEDGRAFIAVKIG